MKLSNNDKNELRAIIEEQLQKVPEGQRIKLDKNILEDLLFEVVELNEEKGIVVKLPIWSGEFLKKIDLSEVDFSDVSWWLLGNDAVDFDDYLVEYVADDNAVNAFNRVRDRYLNHINLNGFVVMYEGTNAKIDLNKSFEALHSNNVAIYKCNFAGVDFSQLNLTCKTITLAYTDISETKLTIPDNMYLEAYRSCLRDIDLSNRKIDAAQYLIGEYHDLGNCDLTNCGVQVIINPEDFKDNQLKEDLREALDNDLVGCYVNGKKVLSVDEKIKISQEKREEYEASKDGIFTSVIGDIEEQIGRMGK